MKRTHISLNLILVLLMSIAMGYGCSKRQTTTTAQPSGQPATQRQQAPSPTVTPQQPTRQQETVPSEVTFGTVFFNFDESNIREDQMNTLNRNAQMLESNSAITVRLEGHCDERGTEEYNMALGQRRADAVQRYLATYGIAAARITTMSYGEMRPAATGSSEDAWSQNRRVEFVVISR